MTRFTKGQVVRAQATAQMLVKGHCYEVIDIDSRATFAGTFVEYFLRTLDLKHSYWVGNGHLLLTEVEHKTDADCVSDGCRHQGDCDVCQVSASDCATCGGVRYHVAGCPDSDAAGVQQDGGNSLLGVDLRDAPIPAHACLENVNDTGHCSACGEKVLRGPVQEVQGLAPSKPIRCF